MKLYLEIGFEIYWIWTCPIYAHNSSLLTAAEIMMIIMMLWLFARTEIIIIILENHNCQHFWNSNCKHFWNYNCKYFWNCIWKSVLKFIEFGLVQYMLTIRHFWPPQRLWWLLWWLWLFARTEIIIIILENHNCQHFWNSNCKQFWNYNCKYVCNCIWKSVLKFIEFGLVQYMLTIRHFWPPQRLWWLLWWLWLFARTEIIIIILENHNCQHFWNSNCKHFWNYNCKYFWNCIWKSVLKFIEFGLVQYMLTIRHFWPPQRLWWLLWWLWLFARTEIIIIILENHNCQHFWNSNCKHFWNYNCKYFWNCIWKSVLKFIEFGLVQYMLTIRHFWPPQRLWWLLWWLWLFARTEIIIIILENHNCQHFWNSNCKHFWNYNCKYFWNCIWKSVLKFIEFGLVQYMLTIRHFWPPQRLWWLLWWLWLFARTEIIIIILENHNCQHFWNSNCKHFWNYNCKYFWNCIWKSVLKFIEFGLVQYMLTIRHFWPPQRLWWLLWLVVVIRRQDGDYNYNFGKS